MNSKTRNQKTCCKKIAGEHSLKYQYVYSVVKRSDNKRCGKTDKRRMFHSSAVPGDNEKEAAIV